jgi:hypothetical protein
MLFVNKWIFIIIICLSMAGWLGYFPQAAAADPSLWHQQTVTFLGTSLDREHHPIGVVATLHIAFRKRDRQESLNVSFSNGPGKFSPLTQVATQSGIKAAARAAGLDSKTWDVFLTFSYPGVTIYGESLSAMVSLAVLAMANDDPILLSRVITGKITQDGHIGPVGGIPLKIQAAYAEHIRRVIISDECFQEDSEWQTPFLMHISPVQTISQAYRLLTGRTLSVTEHTNHSHR